jgi:hypothetical protein
MSKPFWVFSGLGVTFRSNQKLNIMKKVLEALMNLVLNPLVYGVILFIIFAIDLENDRDVFTWLWLLYAQLNLMIWAIREIKRVEPVQEE